MSYRYIIEGLASLESHPDLMEYIKSFDGAGGFMYTIITDPAKKQLENRLSDILDSHGMHSGGSWGCMLRGIQAVLCGAVSRAYMIEKMNEEEEELKRIHELLKQRDAERKAKADAAKELLVRISNIE